MNEEPSINQVLAACLHQRNLAWATRNAVVSEQRQVLVEEPRKVPDVLICSGATVVVEAEVEPPKKLDEAALDRLGRESREYLGSTWSSQPSTALPKTG